MHPIERVGVIGLGNMGAPIARNVIAAGFDTTVFDVNVGRTVEVASAGARAATDVRDAVAGADLVLTSLPGPAQVREVGAEMVPAMRRGSIWADLSTNDLACGRHVAELAAQHGVDVLDAPVTGGVEGAAAGTLVVLVGGEAAAHERCAPVFGAIGRRFDLLGPHGAGYVAKIAQVMLCYLNSVCLAEALVLGVKGGVHPAMMLGIIRESTGRSYVADQYGPEILSGGYDPTFDLALAAKDLHLAMQLAEDVGADLPFTGSVRDLYDAAELEFGARAPHLVAVRMIENANDMILHRHRPEGSTV